MGFAKVILFFAKRHFPDERNLDQPPYVFFSIIHHRSIIGAVQEAAGLAIIPWLHRKGEWMTKGGKTYQLLWSGSRGSWFFTWLGATWKDRETRRTEITKD